MSQSRQGGAGLSHRLIAWEGVSEKCEMVVGECQIICHGFDARGRRRGDGTLGLRQPWMFLVSTVPAWILSIYVSVVCKLGLLSRSVEGVPMGFFLLLLFLVTVFLRVLTEPLFPSLPVAPILHM